jgi:hypothetical protein
VTDKFDYHRPWHDRVAERLLRRYAAGGDLSSSEQFGKLENFPGSPGNFPICSV